MVRADEEPRGPLKAEVFEILMRLAAGAAHGYAIMRDVAERSDGAVDMLPGTLYRHLRWMLGQGLIAELAAEPGPDSADQRRRVYRITATGRAAAEAEAERLRGALEAARDRNLITDGGHR